MNNLKHITVNKNVYQKLKDLGRAGDSFNDVQIRILASVEKEGKKKFD
jgi:predicted CopG family antitoxin